jgi:outer membrane protein assembly factor BamE (lipoprotein component of BamABCDE complex)
MQKKIKIVFCLLLLGTATACSPVTSQHGNMLQDFQVEEVKPGEHTRSDVLRILGSPTTQSTFNNNVWYYIGQETEKRSILDHEVTDERIVAVGFDENGIVQTLEHLDGDRQNIPYTRTKTPTHGNDLTFMQQLLGNLGRFNGGNSQKVTIP